MCIADFTHSSSSSSSSSPSAVCCYSLNTYIPHVIGPTSDLVCALRHAHEFYIANTCVVRVCVDGSRSLPSATLSNTNALAPRARCLLKFACKIARPNARRPIPQRERDRTERPHERQTSERPSSVTNRASAHDSGGGGRNGNSYLL